MHSGKNKGALNLQEWLERDDRALLAQLKAGGFDPAECRNRLFPCLATIVTSLAFDSHTRWGVQPSKENTHAIEARFLAWMSAQGEWSHLEKLFGQLKNGPWSLPIFLTRSHQRFRDAERQETDVGPTKDSVTDSEVAHFTQLASRIGEALVSDLEFQVQNMHDPRAKIVFQLYLEGLVPEELAHWTGTEVRHVREIVAQTKAAIRNGFEEEGKKAS